MRAPALALLLIAAAMAGCLGSDETPDTDNDPPTQQPTSALVGTMPSGQNARDLIESWIMTHPFRVEQDPFQSYMETARDDLEAYLMGIDGLHVERQVYDGGQNILAMRNGTVDPDQWVVLSAHYDTVGYGGVGPTVYGAWDDGAGTALLMEMAAAYSTWDFPFTVVFAFFDGEEKGLVGSSEFVAKYGPTENADIDLLANLNTDPPGLNYPCGDQGPFVVKVIHNMAEVESGENVRYKWLYDAVEYGLNASEIPPEVVDKTAGIPIATLAGVGLRGTSDHASFDRDGVANVFLGGVPLTIVNGDANENTAAALTYGLHTPLDTLEQMEARCVQGSLAGGLQTIADLFSHTLIEMSQQVPA